MMGEKESVGTARSHGFFDISTGMVGADVVIGWVKNGQGFVSDRFASARTTPAVDAIQSLSNMGMMLVSDVPLVTVVMFERPLDTCDTAQDFVISKGKAHITLPRLS